MIDNALEIYGLNVPMSAVTPLLLFVARLRTTFLLLCRYRWDPFGASLVAVASL